MVIASFPADHCLLYESEAVTKSTRFSPHPARLLYTPHTYSYVTIPHFVPTRYEFQCHKLFGYDISDVSWKM
jgi:hypothetical protein